MIAGVYPLLLVYTPASTKETEKNEKNSSLNSFSHWTYPIKTKTPTTSTPPHPFP